MPVTRISRKAVCISPLSGYGAVALTALLTGYLAAAYGLRPEPFYPGVGFAVLGFILSLFLVRETHGHVRAEIAGAANTKLLSQWEIFKRTSLTDRNLSSISQAGLVNNLNDGMAWGLFPLLYASTGLSLADIGWLAAIYPAVWSIGQLFTGTLSDRIGRKWLIAAGMWVQAAGITVTAASTAFGAFAADTVLLGAGTAMVYPTLLAAIGDVAHPAWRAGSGGVYRLWRDLGYAVGALLAGVVADSLGVQASIGSIAALTFLSGFVVAVRMRKRSNRDRNLRYREFSNDPDRLTIRSEETQGSEGEASEDSA